MLLFLFPIVLIAFALGMILHGMVRRHHLQEPVDDDADDIFQDTPDTVDHRLAVHEAGHAVAVWWCTAVKCVHEVTIDSPTGGHVSYDILSDDGADATWCRLVITLAGIAAELSVWPQFRSGASSADLAKARVEAGKIVAMGAYTPPWGPDGTRSPAFAEMYRRELGGVERIILERGYQRAKDLIAARVKDHTRLVVFLLVDRTVNEKKIAEIFGDRAFLRVLGFFGATFRTPEQRKEAA